MSENNFMVENWTNLPEGLVSIITTYINGCEGWRRLKQCDALKELQRKWKPSISNDVVSRRKTPEKSITTYNHEIHSKTFKGDKALSYALNPSEKFMSLIRYSSPKSLFLKRIRGNTDLRNLYNQNRQPSTALPPASPFSPLIPLTTLPPSPNHPAPPTHRNTGNSTRPNGHSRLGDAAYVLRRESGEVMSAQRLAPGAPLGRSFWCRGKEKRNDPIHHSRFGFNLEG